MKLLILVFALLVASAGVAQTKGASAQQRTATQQKKTGQKTSASATAQKGTAQQKAVAQKKTLPPRPVYKEITYKVVGTAHGYNDGEWVKLCTPSQAGFTAYDSIKLADGKFSFEGKGMNVPHMQFIVLGEGAQKNVCELFLEEGTAVVELTAGEKQDRVTGTKHNDLYTPYRDSMNVIYTDLYNCIRESIRTSNSESDRESYKAGADMLRAKMKTTAYNFAVKNINNWAGLYLFAEYHKHFTAQQNKAVLAKMPQKFSILPITAEIRKFVKTQK